MFQMKNKKRVISYFLAFCMMLELGWIPNMEARAAQVEIPVSAMIEDLETSPQGPETVSENHEWENAISNVTISENEVSGNAIDPTKKIRISNKNFPDERFCQYIEDNLDWNQDGMLSPEEVEQITEINISGQEIRDLTGIAYFWNLVSLDCSDNQLEELYLEQNKNLKILNCSENYLAALNLEHMNQLESLSCRDNVVFVQTISGNCIDLSQLKGADGDRIYINKETLEEYETMYRIDNYLYMDAYIEGDFIPYEYDTKYGKGRSIFYLCVDDEEKQMEESVSSNQILKDQTKLYTVSQNQILSTDAQNETKEYKVSTPVLNRALNQSRGKVVLFYHASDNATGYEIQYSKDRKFEKNVVTLKTNKVGYTISNLPKNKVYSFRIRAYRENGDGSVDYGKYSNFIAVRITNGVGERGYSQRAGKLKSCKISYDKTFRYIATVKKRVMSDDEYYYLCQRDPYTNKNIRVVSSVPKETKVSIKLPVVNESGLNLIEGRYALCVKKGSKYKPITKSSYIENPQMAAKYTEPFPKAASKKGIQGADGQSDLGVSHSLINIHLSDLFADGKDGVLYRYNGRNYYFKPNPYVDTIKRCNKDNITISAVFLMPWNEKTKHLITAEGRKPWAAHYYMLNTKKQSSREQIEAAFLYLSELYSREKCHLDNWILGNEVNAPNPWNYAGNVEYEEYVLQYAQAFRTMYYAAVSHNKNARAYISLDNSWTGGNNVYGAREFMVHFNKELKAFNPSIRWNLAYHAYPAPLYASDFWNNSLAEYHENTQHVTMKNLSVLTKFVKTRFGSKTRIILSEQGFTSTGGQNVQAAAIAYAYYIAEFNDMIDAFIIRSSIDNIVESRQGLKMGLRTINGKRKKAYRVFKYMDTPDFKKYTKRCLKTLQAPNWKSIVPGFNVKKLKRMPKRK